MRDRDPKTGGRGPQDTSRWVREWEGPLYNLARRILGNEADAADATQEIFAKLLLSRDRQRRASSSKAWIYRVALNAIRDFSRKRESVRKKEAAAARVPRRRSQEVENGLEAVQRREIQERIQSELARLPDVARVPLVLHYYNGLSLEEVGSVLATPRSTVHSRIHRGLEELRDRLRQSGYAAAAVPTGPVLEEAMRSTAAFSVPSHVSASLGQLAVATSTPGIVSLGLGGLLMKKLSIGIVFVSLASLLAGLGIGHVAFSEPEASSSRSRDRGAESVESPVFAKLQHDYEMLAQRLQSTEAENQRLEEQIERLRAPSMASTSALPETQSGPEPTTIDWNHLSDLFSTHWSVLKQHADFSDEDLSEEDQAALAQIRKAWQEAGAIARSQTAYPFLDEEFLPQILRVAISDTIGLSDGQTQVLVSKALDLLAERQPDEQTSPLRAHQARMEIIDELQEFVPSLLDARQQEDWPSLEGRVNTFLKGQQKIEIFGIEKEPRLRKGVVRCWKRTYDLDDDQVTFAESLVDRYVTSSRQILEKYGQNGDLTAAENRRRDRELLELEVALESAILARLRPEQREALHGTSPLIVRAWTGGTRMSGTSGLEGF